MIKDGQATEGCSESSSAVPAGPAQGELLAALSLRTNISWTFIGNVTYSGCQWAMLAVLAKSGSAVMVGYFALGLATTAPVFMLTNLSLRNIQATDARRQFLFAHYLGLRLITTPLALLIIAGIVAVSGYRSEGALVILAVGLAKASESVSDVFYGLLQQRERMDLIARSMIVKGLVSLLVLAALVRVTHDVLWGTLGLAGVWILILLGYDMRNGALVLQETRRIGQTFVATRRAQLDALHPVWDRRILLRLAWLAAPIGIVYVLLSISTNIPRYFIERYQGSSELGIFAAMAYTLVAGTTIINAIGQSASPRLAQYYAAGNMMAFRSLLLKMLSMGAALGAAGVLIALVAGREILTVLYRPEYAHDLPAFIWLQLGAALEYLAIFLGIAATAARYLKVQVPISVAMVSLMTVASAALIPAHGLLAAAWVTCGAFAVQLVLIGAVAAYALTRRPEVSAVGR